MPTYEYHCPTCARNFDVVQGFHDDPIEACPTCGSSVRKVFGNVGIVFKGSGFYKTDSRTSGNGTTKTAGAESDAPAAASPASDAPAGAGSSANGTGGKDAGGPGSGTGGTAPATAGAASGGGSSGSGSPSTGTGSSVAGSSS